MPSALSFWLERHGPAFNLDHNLGKAGPKLLRALVEVYLMIHGFIFKCQAVMMSYGRNKVRN